MHAQYVCVRAFVLRDAINVYICVYTEHSNIVIPFLQFTLIQPQKNAIVYNFFYLGKAIIIVYE